MRRLVFGLALSFSMYAGRANEATAIKEIYAKITFDLDRISRTLESLK